MYFWASAPNPRCTIGTARRVPYIEIYRRADQWQAAVHVGGMIELRSVNLTLAINDIYASFD